MNTRLLYVNILCLFFSGFSSTVPAEAVPGGIAIIDIREDARPQARYQGKQVMVTGRPGRWQAVVGLSLKTKAGLHRLQINSVSTDFTVTDKQYESQYITIKDRRKVNPNSLDMERIARDKQHIDEAKNTWTDREKDSMELILPVQGRISSPFGLRRFFNRQPRKPHSGLDIAAGEGTAIRAAAAGRVIKRGDYFFNGNTVFIDHGQGMITMYCHMNSIEVEEGQNLAKGEIIGSVGQTGRVTGAHLHWGVILNQTMVDPTLFIAGPANRKQQRE